MQLYKKYVDLWQEGLVCAGFSYRLPDYAIRFWLEQLQKALSEHQGGTFLDIGAGDGRLSLLLLRSYSPQGTAIEVQVDSSVWAPILQRYSRFNLQQGLLQEVLTKVAGKQSFDLIMLVEVFEHIPPGDVPAFLDSLAHVVSSNGCIFVTTPNYVVQGAAEHSSQWHERQPYGHYKHYTHKELVNAFEKVGFTERWHTFECHKTKQVLYNRWFYRVSRWDARLMHSRKLPVMLRRVYRICSTPVILVVRAWFWVLGQLVYWVEKKYNSERTAATTIIVFEKKA